LNANNEEKDYWVKVRGEGDCWWEKTFGLGILRYERDYANSQHTLLNSTIPMTWNDTLRYGKVIIIYIKKGLIFALLKAIMRAFKKKPL
jgi:hypothetical protein